LRKILTYKSFVWRAKVTESLDLHPTGSKFKVGQSVRIGKKIGKITSYRGGKYTVLLGSDQRVCLEKELKPIELKKD